jgi:hypothetical protein
VEYIQCFISSNWFQLAGLISEAHLTSCLGSASQTLTAPLIFFLVGSPHSNKHFLTSHVTRNWKFPFEVTTRKLNAWKFRIPFENLLHVLLGIPANRLIIHLLLLLLVGERPVFDELLLSGKIGQPTQWAGEGPEIGGNINMRTLGQKKTCFLWEDDSLVKATSGILLCQHQVVSISPFIMKPLWDL